MQEAELRKLFDMYYLPVMRYLSHLTGEATAAQDLSQEVFLKLYHYGPSTLENPRAWLFQWQPTWVTTICVSGEPNAEETAAYQAEQEASDLEELAIRSEEKG